MSLYLHEFTHITLSLFVGFIIWKKLNKPISIFAATLLGGVFIDLDHLIDYFLAFGTKFNLFYFLKGYQFLKTEKIYIPLHSWELVIIFFLIILFFMNFKRFITLRTLLLAFSISLFLHLSIDVFTNNMLPQSYFLTYRMQNNFNLKNLVTPSHYQKHLQQKNNCFFNFFI